MKTILSAVLVTLAACGGTAVIDGGQGGAGGAGGSPSTSSSIDTTSPNTTAGAGAGTPGCDQLTQQFTQALNQAMACDSCTNGPDPCEYFSGIELTDTCACPVPINTDQPDLVQNAVNLFETWKAQGCGPFECGEPCAISNNPRCEDSGQGCVGVCAP